MSIWFEELSYGLINDIKRTVTITNSEGNLVFLPDSSIIVRKPEDAFKLENFPCVSIIEKEFNHSTLRYNPEPIEVESNKEKIIYRNSVIPFNILYQIDFWSRYKIDMDNMLKSWLSTHFRQFNLYVKDDLGIERSCNCMTKGKIIESNLILDNERLYHSITELLIWTYIENNTTFSKYKVNDLRINVGGNCFEDN